MNSRFPFFTGIKRTPRYVVIFACRKSVPRGGGVDSVEATAFSTLHSARRWFVAYVFRVGFVDVFDENDINQYTLLCRVSVSVHTIHIPQDLLYAAAVPVQTLNDYIRRRSLVSLQFIRILIVVSSLCTKTAPFNTRITAH